MTKFPEAYLPGYSKFGRIALTTSFVLFLVTSYLCLKFHSARRMKIY